MAKKSYPRPNSTHYSFALDPKEMNKWSKTAVKKVVRLLEKYAPNSIPVLFYSGMSGINHAAYLASRLEDEYIIPIEQVYIRKSTEYAHGRHIERTFFKKAFNQSYCLVFVDDFISSGKTFYYCFKHTMNELSGKSIAGLILCTKSKAGSCDLILPDFSPENKLLEIYEKGFTDRYGNFTLGYQNNTEL